MKIQNIALALSAIISTTQQVRANDSSADPTSTLQTWQAPEKGEEEVNNRYIVKFKPGSRLYKKRMRQAGRKFVAKTNNLRKRNKMNTPNDIFLLYGRFLPQDDAEVFYLNSDEEVKVWQDNDDVEYVEPGE